jgi:hypothetical protein
MTTYTVWRKNDISTAISGLTAQEAANVILTHDGNDYRIEAKMPKFGDDPYWRVMVPNPGGGAFVELTRCSGFFQTANEAGDELAQMVIRESYRWDDGTPEVMTDKAFAEMMADAALVDSDD